VVGKSGSDTIVHEDLAASERIAIPSTDASTDSGALQPEEEATDSQLTFYNTLPEGRQPPMGSGINMPDQTAEQPSVPAEVLPSSEKAVVVSPKPLPVEVKPKPSMPKPQPTATVAAQPSPAPASVATGGSYIIQVASVQKIDGAQDLIGRLSKNGYPAFVEKTDLGSKGVWYRVYVGPFASKSAADGAALTLRVSHLASSPIVRKR
jgi:cell division septation protein DedD